MSELALPDPTREPIPAGWSEALLERLTQVEDVSTLDSGRATIAGYIAAYRAKGADTRELQRGERFVEVRIGELLGPPRPGERTDLSPTGDRLPADRAYEFRQLAAHRDRVIAWIRAGVLGRRKLLANVRALAAGPTAEQNLDELPEFPVLYADPPWQYEHVETTDSRAIENQYTTMTAGALANMAVPVAEHAVLFLWATNPKLPEALQVMAAWGFGYRTNMVWVKDRIGMGYYVRGQHELLLIGKRGELPVPAPSDRPASVIQAPRTEHSAKPEVVYDLIEQMYPGLAKVELFARQQRPGWAAWGHQAEAVA